MPERLIRTFGATALLIAIAAAGVFQLSQAEEPGPVEIVELATDSSQPASADSTLAEEDIEKPFVYKIGILEGISTNNFWEYFGSAPTVWDAYVLAPTRASLYSIDPQTLELAPEFAREYSEPTWNEEGWKVTVPLRGDLAWSDGQALTAGDLVFTFETARRLKLGGQWSDAFPASVVEVKALDSYHVELRFASRPSLDVWPYGVGLAPIMAKHFWETGAAGVEAASELYEVDASEDVSSGPMDIVEIESDRIVSRANPGFRGQAGDIVEYRVFGADEEALEAIRAGDIHTLLSPKGLTPEQADALANTEGISTVTSPEFGVRYLGFNLTRQPMDLTEFRQAVSLLLDREELAEDVAKAPVARSLLQPFDATWFDEESAGEIAERRPPERAARFDAAMAGLKSRGFTWSTEPALRDGEMVAGEGLQIDGRHPAALTILTSGDSYDAARPEYANRIAETIELLGFKVIPVSTGFATVVDLTFNPDEEGKVRYDMVVLGWSLGNPGFPSFYGDLFGTGGIANNTGYSSESMDALIKNFGKSYDRDTAKKILWEMEALIAADIPYLPLYASQITEAYRSDQISFGDGEILGGIQAALGGIELVTETG